MMTRATVGLALLGAGFLIGQAVPVVWSQPGEGGPKKGPPGGGPKGRPGPHDPKGPPPHGPHGGPPPHGPHAFHEAYHDLGESAALAKAAGDKLPSEARKLLDAATDVYKAAVKEAKGGDRHKAMVMAHAAADAGRGAKHLVHGLVPEASDLPKPPEGFDGPPPPPPGRPKGPPRGDGPKKGPPPGEED